MNYNCEQQGGADMHEYRLIQNVTSNGTVETVSGLTPNVSVYSFQVAAVGANQKVGPFSNPANISGDL